MIGMIEIGMTKAAVAYVDSGVVGIYSAVVVAADYSPVAVRRKRRRMIPLVVVMLLV